MIKIQTCTSFFSLLLSSGSVLELTVMKNDAEWISQRRKWTSGARVMIILGRAVARSLGRFVADSLARTLTCSIARSHDRSIARSLGRSIARSLVDRSIVWSINCSIARSALTAMSLGLHADDSGPTLSTFVTFYLDTTHESMLSFERSLCYAKCINSSNTPGAIGDETQMRLLLGNALPLG